MTEQYFDLGQYIMKLFDQELIAASKDQMGDCKEHYVREITRQAMARGSVSLTQAEHFVREMADKLMRINQDLLNQASISIAKKARTKNRNQSKVQEADFEELNEQVGKKDREIEGLIAKTQSLEQRAQILEKEKNETLAQLTNMNSVIQDLQNRVTVMEREYTQQIAQLNADWQQKMTKTQEEWDSYMKLKLAEKEIQATKKSPTESESE
jgi:chromosome segregation ATPase